jgi:hypothetical protein
MTRKPGPRLRFILFIWGRPTGNVIFQRPLSHQANPVYPVTDG